MVDGTNLVGGVKGTDLIGGRRTDLVVGLRVQIRLRYTFLLEVEGTNLVGGVEGKGLTGGLKIQVCMRRFGVAKPKKKSCT